MTKEVKAIECRFVFHVPESASNPDTHVVKELVHYEDGTTAKNLRTIVNYKRPFWVTQEHYRNHEQKKESESVKKLLKGLATESGLARAAASKLGSRYVGISDMRRVKASPYVYGLDINSRTYIKKAYQDRYKVRTTPYEVCILDIEVDTIKDDITIITITTNERMYTCITKDFLRKVSLSKTTDGILEDVTPKLDYLFKKHIPKNKLLSDMEVLYDVVDSPADAVVKIFDKLHAWSPDLVSGWNIMYDIEHMVEALERAGIDPADIFSDPGLPKELRRFKIKMGQTQKVTVSGKSTPINPQAQWHSVDCPASFYWVDAMSTHQFIRVGGKSLPGGYSLDVVLKHELGDDLGKLYFKDDPNIDRLKGIEWHRYMTAERPLEYVIYNQWDVMSILVMDSETSDLNAVLPMLSGISNFDIFNSGPKRIVDAMHFYYLEHDKVLGTKSPIVDDKNLLGLDSWIVMLPTYRVSDTTMSVLKDDSGYSNARGYVYDADVTSAYPNATRVANVSIETTLRELKSIGGIPLSIFRTANLNLLYGKVNSLSYGSTMFNLPQPLEMIEFLEEKIKM